MNLHKLCLLVRKIVGEWGIFLFFSARYPRQAHMIAHSTTDDGSRPGSGPDVRPNELMCRVHVFSQVL